MSGRIEKEFETFAAACFGAMGKQQWIDLKRTFYGGVTAFMAIVQAAPEGESDEDTLSGIQAELLRFNEDVKAGRA